MTTVSLNSSANKYFASDEREDYSIDGGAGNDTIAGNDGNDTIIGGRGNDSLAGCAGVDTFIYANGDGNDIIDDYEEDDLIKITSGTVSKISTASNGDVIFKIGSGKITVKNAGNKIITYEDPNSEKHFYPVNVNAAGTSATLLAEYGKDEFNAVTFDDSETLKNIDASAVKHDMTITGNKNANNIVGTSENDSIAGGAGADKIDGGDGNDTIEGGTGNDVLTGGDGADVFVWNKGDGNDKILDYANEDTISISGDTVKGTTTIGENIILKLASGKNISVIGGKDHFITYIDEDGEHVYPENPIVVNPKKTAVTLLAGYSADTFDVTSYDDFGTTARSIDASAVDHDLTITGNKQKNVIIGADGDNIIDGGAGADKLYGGSGNNTLIGGKGNDTLEGGTGSNVFVYENGGGNDVITNYKSGDVIQVSGTVSGAGFNDNAPNDYVFTVGEGKITLKDARNKYIKVIDDTGSYWYPEPPEAQLVYSSGKVEIKKGYKGDTFDVADFEDGFPGKVYTIDASAVQHSLSIIGNKEKNEIIGTDDDDYIDGKAGADKLFGGDGDDTIVGGTGNDYLTGGDGADVFVWNKGDGNDKILDYASEDKISISGDTVSSVRTSGDNVILRLASGKNISVIGGKDYVINYTDDEGEHSYPEDPVIFNKKGTAATILAGYTEDIYDFSGNSKLVSLDASAVEHSLSLTGNKNKNVIIGTEEDDYIAGKAGVVFFKQKTAYDIIEGGTGNDSLTGGEGADTFVWNKGDGNDKIYGFANEDNISISGATVKSVKTSGDNVILTIGSNKISVMGGADKVINYSDDAGVHGYPVNPIVVNAKGTAVTLLSEYSADTFDVTAQKEFGTTARTIDASAVDQDLSIIGNKQKNLIIGGDGNNTIDGGKGNDTLTGGTGSNVFVYANGGGNDVITNYKSGDVIQVSGTVSSAGFNDNAPNDYVFTVGEGKITLKDARNKFIKVIDDTGSYWYPDNPEPYIVYSSGKVEIKKGYVGDSFDVADFEDGFAGKVYTIDASAVKHSLSITGNKQANEIIGTGQKDYIDGGAGADVIYGGKGNDSLVGGDGADEFVWNKGDGNDKILDYEDEDTIRIVGDTVKSVTTAKNGEDIIFTLTGKNKITVVGGADNIISYTDDDNPEPITYPDINKPVIYNEDFTAATLTSNYNKSSFDTTDYSAYVGTLATIDASAVTHSIDLYGSGLANQITGSAEDDYIDGDAGKDTLYGGEGNNTLVGGAGNDSLFGGSGNDSLWGGAGNDTLFGGEGEDIFVYKADGNDVIADFTRGDTIMILSGNYRSWNAKGGDVTFNFDSSSKLVVKDGADKYITLVDSSHRPIDHYEP
ncbi:MAG: hypothetical protein SR1Q5_07765 [Quinella sp. 1Q5]|nr:hypothetical protein [Quinella sp. 1Q5]